MLLLYISESSPETKTEYDSGTLDRNTFESTFDSRTYDDGTYDDHTFSSGGSRSDGSYTFGSATLESMALNKRERRKWSAWDKKDLDSVHSSSSTYDSEYTMDTRQRNRVLERRARAHEQLLMHAYTALSKPAKRTALVQDSIPQFLPTGIPSGGSDVENQRPSNQLNPSKSILKQRQILEKFSV